MRSNLILPIPCNCVNSPEGNHHEKRGRCCRDKPCCQLTSCSASIQNLQHTREHAPKSLLKTAGQHNDFLTSREEYGARWLQSVSFRAVACTVGTCKHADTQA
jgi:hypothetical protein